jgi:hypothetical protein
LQIRDTAGTNQRSIHESGMVRNGGIKDF